MIGWILCHLGIHEWWARSTWTPRLIESAVLDNLAAVCGRCPARKYRAIWEIR